VRPSERQPHADAEHSKSRCHGKMIAERHHLASENRMCSLHPLAARSDPAPKTTPRGCLITASPSDCETARCNRLRDKRGVPSGWR
jgi:hypothetical protein